MAIDLTKAKLRLKKRQEELKAQSEMSEEARQAVELDQSAVGRLSRMDAMQQQAMAQAQERLRKRDIIRIEQAQGRLADGDYGFCANCDAEIPDARLAIDPMAECCIKCA